MSAWWPEIVAALQIIWIDLVLSGDNAVVIALACRGLPAKQRKWGIILGAGAAIILRVIFALLVIQLLQVPFLKVIGAFLLLRIAVGLTKGQEDEHDEIRESGKLWGAVWTIVVADAVMSLDNVIAIAAVAQDHIGMLIFGLALSIPLIVFGANILVKAIDRFPILIWAGAALLGWVAGGMLITDPWMVKTLGADAVAIWKLPVEAAGVLLVVGLGWLMRRLAQRRRAASADADVGGGI
ncbi:membrane protein [Camelimonas fluminis]|uniref:TerC family protein n=1 Tax=Camelimonas fluminis TaxID=1576911 RepID=A0ABV7UIQ8_9HYPH|nr:TerC family protein [Camelimonas fluminis]GHE68022.1 membrane protein [Camelimonas fluminis]